MCECFPVISSANHGPTTTTLIFANKPTVFHSPLTRRDFWGFTSNSYAEVLVVFGGFVLGFSMVREPGGYKGYEREDCGRASGLVRVTGSSPVHLMQNANCVYFFERRMPLLSSFLKLADIHSPSPLLLSCSLLSAISYKRKLSVLFKPRQLKLWVDRGSGAGWGRTREMALRSSTDGCGGSCTRPGSQCGA
jgi:hypothetical protein